MEVKVNLYTDEDYKTLALLKFNGDVYPGFARVYLIPDELEKLKAIGLEYEILDADLNRTSSVFWSSMDRTRDAYHTFPEIVALADSLAGNFPDICEKHIFGYSVFGYELGALKISDNVALDENEAEVMFDGGIHGDEVGCSENVIRFARDLCIEYGNNPTITDLINNREIWLYYCVNPYGRIHITRRNANGVDLNRDWGYMWDGWGGSWGAYSQPESKALRNCMYNRQFVVHTTYHSGTEYISCPWSYRPDHCPDYTHIMQLAGVYSSTSGYSNLLYGQGCTGMYPINGSSKDTNYGMMGSISWSMEISYSKHPPPSQIMLYYNRNKPAMLAMIEYSGYGVEGVVTDAVTGDPVQAIVGVNDYFPTYTDAEIGDYHKYVLPGSYTITVTANGYESQTVNDIIVPSLGFTITDFQLQPSSNSYYYGYKFSASQIPDNNWSDEGNTPGCLCAPDDINYSIGKNGWCIIDMQYPIIDAPYNDFTVFEGDASPEGFTCYVSQSMDGPFLSIGSGTGTTEFDISVAGLPDAQFIKIVDDGDGSATIPDAGFDLDAISTEFIQGPNLVFIDYFIDDSIGGNDNGSLDPGESADLYIVLKNNGTLTAEDIIANLYSYDQYVTIYGTLTEFEDLTPGQVDTGYVNIFASPTTPESHPANFNLDISCNNGTYSSVFLFTILIGQPPIEDFETGDFSSYDWVHGGNADWTVLTDNPYEGIYCAKSGAISHSQSTQLSVNLDVYGGNISFYRRVSSEAGYDYLKFYIDGVAQGQWAGTVNWGEVSYSVSSGNHTFKWSYEKDEYVSSGSDCAWIDFITFPPIVPTYPVFSLSPCSIDFGEVIIGEDSTSQFTIYNFGGDTLCGTIRTPDGYTVAETGTSYMKNQISYSILAGQSEIYDLTFEPTLQQSYNGNVIITIAPSQREFLPVSGIGILEISITEMDFYTENKLFENYPNPAVKSTIINYQLKGSVFNQNAFIKIYNIRGELVKTVEGKNGKALLDVSNIATGIYFYQIKTKDYDKVKKMVVIR
ncbi:MAG: T9SS type A sorting domain-containing protein [Candidatus Cloacimonetes bacterium]|nr:T9SS type A sorting domain-containing protein [Candidatus Cloacimonadota bacterium]